MPHQTDDDMKINRAGEDHNRGKCVICNSVGAYAWVEGFCNSNDDLNKQEQIQELLQEGKKKQWPSELIDNVPKYITAHIQLRSGKLSKPRKDMYQRIKNDFVKSLNEWDEKVRKPAITHQQGRHISSQGQPKPKSFVDEVTRDLRNLRF